MPTVERNARRTLIGIVTSAKTPKTITVEVQRTFRHPKYGKFLRRRKRYLVHDEEGKAQVGDEVEIASTRPLSRRKRWRLVGTVAKSRLADIGYVDTAAQVMAEIRGEPRPEDAR